MASAAAVIMVGMADSSTLACSISPDMPKASDSGNASAGITSRRSSRPTASGFTSSRGSFSWMVRPTASITSGSNASASFCRAPPIQAGGCSGISVSPTSRAHTGGNFRMRRPISRAVGGASPP